MSNLMRTLYSLLFYCLLPFIGLRLLWRSLKAPAYRLRWRERLGYYTVPPSSNVIWIHAVSVGEAEAVFPLVKHLLATDPTQEILMTTTTPTGSARVTSVMGKQVSHVYLPYDTLGAVRRFYTHFKPRIAVIMETELWPNLFSACGQRNIPLFIINARLSEKSARGYQKIPSLIHLTLANVTTIATQSALDTQRFLAIGATDTQVVTCGNIKFDLPSMDDVIVAGQTLREQLFPKRFVWIIASTHKDEELYFLSLLPQLKIIAPTLLLLIAPRHPERFSDVSDLCLKHSLKVVSRTSNRSCDTDTDVYLIDTIGELKMFYATADMAFVGGSMVPVGGHNVLEPAAVNVPIMFGPYMRNFAQITQDILNANAAVQCLDTDALLAGFKRLYEDSHYRDILVTNAREFVLRNQGATQRVLTLISAANTGL